MTVMEVLNQNEDKNKGKTIRILSAATNQYIGPWWQHDTKPVDHYKTTNKYFLIYV